MFHPSYDGDDTFWKKASLLSSDPSLEPSPFLHMSCHCAFPTGLINLVTFFLLFPSYYSFSPSSSSKYVTHTYIALTRANLKVCCDECILFPLPSFCVSQNADGLYDSTILYQTSERINYGWVLIHLFPPLFSLHFYDSLSLFSP